MSMFNFGYNRRPTGLFSQLDDPANIAAIAQRRVPTAMPQEDEEERRRGSGLLSNLGLRIFGDDNRFFGQQEDGSTFRDRMMMAAMALGGDARGAVAYRQGLQEQQQEERDTQAAAAEEANTVRRAFNLARQLGERDPDNRRRYLNGAMADPAAFLTNYAATFEPQNLSQGQTRFNPYAPDSSYMAGQYVQNDGMYGTQTRDGLNVVAEDQTVRKGLRLGNDQTRSGIDLNRARIDDIAADNARADAAAEGGSGGGYTPAGLSDDFARDTRPFTAMLQNAPAVESYRQRVQSDPNAANRTEDGVVLTLIGSMVQSGVLTDADIARVAGQDMRAIIADWEGFVTGTGSLTPDQRQNLFRVFDSAARSARIGLRDTATEYARVAERNNIDPADIVNVNRFRELEVLDFGETGQGGGGPAELTPAEIQRYQTMTDEELAALPEAEFERAMRAIEGR